MPGSWAVHSGPVWAELVTGSHEELGHCPRRLAPAPAPPSSVGCPWAGSGGSSQHLGVTGPRAVTTQE